MFERFTAQARAVVLGAQEHARRLGDHHLGCEHLLLAVATSSTPAGEVLGTRGITATAIESTLTRRQTQDPFQDIDKHALAAIGIDLDQVRAHVEGALGPQSRDRSDEASHRRRGLFGRRHTSTWGHLPFTKHAKTCLEQSLRECLAARDSSLGVEHLALALTGTDSAAVRQVLTENAVSPTELRAAFLQRYRRAS